MCPALTAVAGDDSDRGVGEGSSLHSRHGSHREAVSPVCLHLDCGPSGGVGLHQLIGEAIDRDLHHIASEDAILVRERGRLPGERDHTGGQVGWH